MSATERLVSSMNLLFLEDLLETNAKIVIRLPHTMINASTQKTTNHGCALVLAGEGIVVLLQFIFFLEFVKDPRLLTNDNEPDIAQGFQTAQRGLRHLK